MKLDTNVRVGVIRELNCFKIVFPNSLPLSEVRLFSLWFETGRLCMQKLITEQIMRQAILFFMIIDSSGTHSNHLQ